MGKIKRLAIVAGATSSMFIALFACSSSSSSGGGGTFSCSAKSACPNDPPADQNKCQQQLSDPNCGTKYQALDQCTLTNQKCGSDGKTDSAGTLQPCQQQFSDALQCALQHPMTDAGGGG